MDVTPSTTSKRARSKSKQPAPQSKTAAAEKPKITIRKSRAANSAEPATATAEVAFDLNERIATTAYFLAAERNFTPGHELDDWLEAERRVRGHN